MEASNLEKLAAAILVYVPEGSMRPGDVENVDALTLMNRTGFSAKELHELASNTRLAKLVGVSRTSFIKPTTKSRKDKGVIRLQSK